MILGSPGSDTMLVTGPETFALAVAPDRLTVAVGCNAEVGVGKPVQLRVNVPVVPEKARLWADGETTSSGCCTPVKVPWKMTVKIPWPFRVIATEPPGLPVLLPS